MRLGHAICHLEAHFHGCKIGDAFVDPHAHIQALDCERIETLDYVRIPKNWNDRRRTTTSISGRYSAHRQKRIINENEWSLKQTEKKLKKSSLIAAQSLNNSQTERLKTQNLQNRDWRASYNNQIIGLDKPLKERMWINNLLIGFWMADELQCGKKGNYHLFTISSHNSQGSHAFDKMQQFSCSKNRS